MTVDLTERTATLGERLRPGSTTTQWRLLNGLGNIGITLQDEGAIADYGASRPTFKPVIR